jgi:polysaccharide export outer membrane protein
LETLANVFRSDQLAWQVIRHQQLYREPAFMGNFAARFPRFDPNTPSPDAQAFLFDRFQRRLTVQTLPRTLVLQIRFRSKNAALSAAVVNGLIASYGEQDREARVRATSEATAWLDVQLKQLKARGERDDQALIEFQRKHKILETPVTLANGRGGVGEHTSGLLEIDELGRELVNATTDRILREAEYRAASSGNPELVLASDPRIQANGDFATALLQQLHTRRSELQQEQTQLGIEHGPNFPRVVEIRDQIRDVDLQIKAEDHKLQERFQSAWTTAVSREELVRNGLNARTEEGMRLNEAVTQFAVMRQEANSSHELYMRVLEKTEESGLAAGIHNSNISVVDHARQPIKPVSPDLLLYMPITLFVSIWLAIGGALVLESIHPSVTRVSVVLLTLLMAGVGAFAQAPTPSTSGLPTGVARFPQSTERKDQPNAKEAPTIWNTTQGAITAGAPSGAIPSAGLAMPAPIGPGDLLEITESHTPEFKSAVRVSDAGSVVLALAGEVQIGGMDERVAAQAIEAALIARGMLLHPQVIVLVTGYAGQDVSILGEVKRPGVYPYTVHHRLLDLISAASGLGPNAGRLVTIIHRDDPETVLPVSLDPQGADQGGDHNPELVAGDTVQVSSAGLVYVVGDVVRPGAFPVDPVQGITLVQAITLAWGPSQNAALSKAVLIREQAGGRTITSLDLKRMLRGVDPDLPIHDRDIIFVPDSVAKNLWNRTMESVVQSAVGVSIYAGMVYSQRF